MKTFDAIAIDKTPATLWSRVPYLYSRFVGHPGFYVMRLLGRFNAARTIAPYFYERTAVRSYENKGSVFPELDVDEAVRGLKKDGLFLGIQLPEDLLENIIDYAARADCYGDRNPTYGFRCSDKQAAEARIGKRFVVGSYFNTASDCPAIKQLADDPKLLNIAAGYLGVEPTLLGTQLWWSYATATTTVEKNRHAQMFHHDLDDFAFIKFFFYLTDVDDSSGPHVCVRGSHKKKQMLHRLLINRLPDEDVVKYYGARNIVTIHGKAGSGFAEDTFASTKAFPRLAKIAS